MVAAVVVMVNGLPGSGKSALAAELAGPLDAALLSKDAVKEALVAAASRVASVPSLGAVAMDTVWALAAGCAGTVVVESWWFRPRDLPFARSGLLRSGAASGVEVWCDVPAAVARSRYGQRQRDPLYDDARRLVEDWPVWELQAEPLGLLPVVRIDTDRPVDVGAAVDAINRQIVRGGRSPE